MEQGKAYPCFCTDEELQQMKAEAEAKSLPPIYRGKWASASQEEVQQELAKVGTALQLQFAEQTLLQSNTSAPCMCPPRSHKRRLPVLQGTPHCYRFRVPADKDILIPDRIRGDVRFNTNALGDFVILRSNGLPVYNFCVAVDDALMRITHVIRAVRSALTFPVTICYISPMHYQQCLDKMSKPVRHVYGRQMLCGNYQFYVLVFLV